MTDQLMVATDVSVSFKVGRNRLRAVDGVSLSIGRGETVGLVGESGSGKSTLGLAIMRAHVPDSGSVVFDGVDITHMSERELRPLRSRMQMVFQNPFASLDPKMSVGRIVSEPLRLHRWGSGPEIEARVGELLTMVGLPESAARRKPAAFSGGQKQRISIARALASEPEFLVADEPVSSLDVSIQAQVVAVLEDVKRRLGLTSLVIAHDLPLVYQITDRVAVMYLGQIVEVGPTTDVVYSPAHPYTVALLSASPVPDPEVQKTRRRIVLAGDPPSPIDPPPGCRFHTRCPIARPRCVSDSPRLQPFGRQMVACHFPGELGAVLTQEPTDSGEAGADGGQAR